MWVVALAWFFLQASDPVSDGQKALQEGKFEAAVRAFTEAIAADPKDYFSHFNLALAYGYLRRDAEGVAEYRKTLELKPGLFEAELNAGMLLMRDKEPAEALPLLEAAAEQRPAEFQPRFYLAQAQLDTGAPDLAEGNFRRALEADPKSGDSQLGLARSLVHENKLAEAAPHFRQAAEMDPAHRNALLELAGLYEKNDQLADAIAIYREFPGNAAAEERLGQLLLESRQYAEGVARMESAYAKDPSAANRILLAQAYLLNRQPDKAAPLLEKSVASEPANFDLRTSYARALRDLRQFPAAVAQFQEAAKLKPTDAMTWSELAAARYMTGDVDETLADLDRARDLGENTAGNWFFRAIILDKAKRLKPALEAYQRFLSMSQGKNPDQEFQARQRARIIKAELERK
jgi:tetratricopeptide (TPR) repeat protein